MEEYSKRVNNFLHKIFFTKENGFQTFYRSLNRYIASSSQMTFSHQHNCRFCEMIMTLSDDDDHQLITEKMICINLLTERLPVSTFGCVIIWYYIKQHIFELTDEDEDDEEAAAVFQIDVWSIFKHFFVGDCKTIKQYNGYSANLVYEYMEVKNNVIITKSNSRKDEEDVQNNKSWNKTLTRLFDTAKHLYTYGPCFGYNAQDKTRCIYSNCGSYDNNITYLPSLKPFVSRDHNNLIRDNILITKLTTGNVDDHCEVNLVDSFQFQVKKQSSHLPTLYGDAENQHEDILDKWTNIKKVHNILASISQDNTFFSFLNNTLGTCLMCSLSICDIFRICLEDFNCMCHDFLMQKKLLTNSLPVTVGLIKAENLGSKSYSRLSASEAECKFGGGDKKRTLKKHKRDFGGILSFQLDRHTNISPVTCSKIFNKWVTKYPLLHLDYFATYSDFLYKHFVGSEHFFCISNRRRVLYNSDDIFTKSHSCLLPFFIDLGCLLYKEKSHLSSTYINKILTSNIFNLAKQHHIPEVYITHMII